MHGDEAVMAVKAGAIAWGGEGSAYDPTGYHGTLLGWLTRPVLMLTGARSLADTDERHFRLVTAVCGILLCLTPWLLADGLGPAGAQIGGLLLAISPAFVYWSRFYIQEVPLVLATALGLGCGWRFSRSNRSGWLWAASASAGLMLSLKETAWLSFIAGGIALAAVRPARTWIANQGSRLLLPGLTALAIPALLLGPSALLAPIHYWRLGLGGGDHAHPWHWYATAVLAPPRNPTEWIVPLLALIVPAGLWRPSGTPAMSRSLAGILATWTLTLTCAYALLPYKTPWCALNFLLGAALLAGAGIAVLMRAGRRMNPGSAWLALGLAVAMVASARDLSFRKPADRRNPFVYAQPVEDVRRLGRLAGKIAAVHPAGREMIVAVVTENPWPLPWELRAFPNVGYWEPGEPGAAQGLKIAAIRVTPAMPASRGLMFGLRPGEILSVEADQRLLDRALRRD